MNGNYKLVIYKMVTGKEPFTEWFQSLSDEKTRAVVGQRLSRVERGNFGIIRNVGNSVYEFKINFGPGYRIYFSYVSKNTVVILKAGSKRSQAQDILAAQFYREDHFRRLV